MRILMLCLIAVSISTSGITQVTKNSRAVKMINHTVSKGKLALETKDGHVVFLNPKFNQDGVKFKLDSYKADFTTKRFGKGYLVLKFDGEANIYSMKMPVDLYKRMKKECEEEEFIVMMTSQEYLDGLKKCADKPSSAGVVTCAIRHTIQMYKDCINATPATEHIHCW